MLFVRKLATSVTEELLEKTFSQFGKLERVKKLKDYAFVHFEERDAAVKVIIKLGRMCDHSLEGQGGLSALLYLHMFFYMTNDVTGN